MKRTNNYDKVSCIYDEKRKWAGRIQDAWVMYKANAVPDLRRILGSGPQFLDDEHFMPLQAADLLAGMIRKEWNIKLRGGVPSVEPWSYPRVSEFQSGPGIHPHAQLSYNETQIIDWFLKVFQSQGLGKIWGFREMSQFSPLGTALK